MDKKEIRMAEIRIAQADSNEMIVSGCPVVYDAPTVLWEYDGIQYKEVIDRGALDGADMADVPFKYNHSSNVMVMARTRNKTLQLVVTEAGLSVTANLAPTSAGKDLYELIKRGDIDKMSFAFVVKQDYYDRDMHTRHIKKIKKLYDVSAVDMPAYDSTSISARSYFEAEAEKELHIQRERKRMILRTYF